MKYIQYLKIVIFITIFIPDISNCQDLTYKSDGNILNINIISIKDGTLIYYLPGDTTGKIFYLSTSLVDSVKYRDGRSMIFPSGDLVPETIKRNYIGIDFIETFLTWIEDFRLGPNNLHLSYEHIFKSGRTAFTVELLWSIHSYYQAWAYRWDGNWACWNGLYLSYDPFNFFTKVGINTYPFNYSLVRTGRVRFCTGGSLLLGSITKYDWDIGYLDETRDVFIAGIVWNVDAKIYLANALQIKLGLDASVIPFLVFCSPELGITLSF